MRFNRGSTHYLLSRQCSSNIPAVCGGVCRSRRNVGMEWDIGSSRRTFHPANGAGLHIRLHIRYPLSGVQCGDLCQHEPVVTGGDYVAVGGANAEPTVGMEWERNGQTRNDYHRTFHPANGAGLHIRLQVRYPLSGVQGESSRQHEPVTTGGDYVAVGGADAEPTVGIAIETSANAMTCPYQPTGSLPVSGLQYYRTKEHGSECHRLNKYHVPGSSYSCRAAGIKLQPMVPRCRYVTGALGATCRNTPCAYCSYRPSPIRPTTYLMVIIAICISCHINRQIIRST